MARPKRLRMTPTEDHVEAQHHQQNSQGPDKTVDQQQNSQGENQTINQ